MKKEKILLIEDNEDIRNNTCEILELANYEVGMAVNGKKGVEKAIEFLPDLIICDIMMPELDGFGVLHAIQRNDAIKNTPFIFLTAKSERGDFRKGMESGADDYITKPFGGIELLNTVERRLKKIESLKQVAYSGLEGLINLTKVASIKNPRLALTENRNVDTYVKKQIIYSEGNRPQNLYYLQKGKVKTYKSNSEGKELVTNLFVAGDFFGHIPLLEGTLYLDTAETLENTELIIIPKEEFDHLINNDKEVSGIFIQILAENVSFKENQLLAMAYNSLRKKVADALLMVRKKYDKNGKGKFMIDMTRENLANIAGTATESLVRTLTDFKNEHLIEISDGKIALIDLYKLEHLAN
ncbi:MAG: response regulator [Saprospiraceae bacterium]|uniref:Response regulator n=1 Tax=Candidatus Opimibacter skivensis TaxID=2982028 RepID=A0A9D7XS67_9BACT|nr:response regulator [Candidatus Opimibacter skivensis]